MNKYFRIILLVAVFLIGLVYVYSNWDDLAILTQVKTVDLVPLGLNIFLFFGVTGYTFYLLVKMVGVRLSVLEVVSLTFITNFGNYLAPTRPGAAIKAIYLKGEKNIPFSVFTAVLAANGFVVLFVSGITGLFLLAVSYIEGHTISFILVAMSALFIFVALIPVVIQLESVPGKGKVQEIIQQAMTGFNQIRKQKRALLKVCLSIWLQYIFSAISLMLAYRAIGLSIPFLPALLIGVFTSMSNLFTLTPNNLGLQEVVIAYLVAVAGFDFNSGLVASGIIRIIHLLLTFVLTPILSTFLLKNTNIRWSAIFNFKANTRT